MLRRKLEEAQRMVERNNLQKVNMQENLKKAFMRGVCALNFEAMNILDPNGGDPTADKAGHLNQIEREMMRQFEQAESPSGVRKEGPELAGSNLVTPGSHVGLSARQFVGQRGNESRFANTDGGLTYSASAVSEVSGDSSEDIVRPRDQYVITKDLTDEIKIESKEHMWRPAPIVGRDFSMKAYEPEVYRAPMQNNFMNRYDEMAMQRSGAQWGEHFAQTEKQIPAASIPDLRNAAETLPYQIHEPSLPSVIHHTQKTEEVIP